MIIVYEIPKDHPGGTKCECCGRKYHKELMKLHGVKYWCLVCHLNFLNENEFGPSMELALQVLDNDETLN